MGPVSRRTFVLGSIGALALAACGGDDDDDERVAATSTTAATAGLTVYRVFNPKQPAATALRLPVALADADGALLDDVPQSITASWHPGGAGDASDEVEIPRHADGIPTPYFPIEATFPTVGTWEIEIVAAGERATTSVRVVEAKDVPAVPGPGERLIAVETPTTSESQGVDPICTREPPCPFHETTLEDAMASGKAIAFIISTPQFCQTAICGPVLELLIDRHEELTDAVAFVHAEVYTDGSAKETTDAVKAYGLTYEPALFLAAPDGTITTRLDYTFDRAEVNEALDKLVQ